MFQASSSSKNLFFSLPSSPASAILPSKSKQASTTLSCCFRLKSFPLSTKNYIPKIVIFKNTQGTFASFTDRIVERNKFSFYTKVLQFSEAELLVFNNHLSSSVSIPSLSNSLTDISCLYCSSTPSKSWGDMSGDHFFDFYPT